MADNYNNMYVIVNKIHEYLQYKLTRFNKRKDCKKITYKF